MSWLSRVNDRAAERELRTSWRRALVQAAVIGLVAAVLWALMLSGRGYPWWLSGAVIGGLTSVMTTVLTRAFALWEARNSPRNR